MRGDALPKSRDLVLIGGGHAHALLLKRWAMRPLAGTRLTLIDPGVEAYYSGMLPGALAGHFSTDEITIDLVRLAQSAGARFVHGAASGIDLEQGAVHVPGRPAIEFDLASLDIGIHTMMPDLPGFAEHVEPVKPIGPFVQAWLGFVTGSGPARVAVIGGGVAGVEVALAMAFALRARGRRATVSVIEAGNALKALRPAAARRLVRALNDQGIALHENNPVRSVEPGRIILDEGHVEAEFICGAAGAMPHGWLNQSGLRLHRGFAEVDATLRTSDARIFAVGDCAHMATSPRPKAGVYAVRQAPILDHNLRCALRETGRFRRYRPQRDYLKLITLGDRSALMARMGPALAGPWVWRWKDRIDRKFMARLSDLPQMPPPALPRHHTAGLLEAIGPKPLCGGCGSKVGQGALEGAVTCPLPLTGRADIEPLPGDDAACLNIGGARQVISTDHLRAMIEDPVTMTRIAVNHALGDIWAMGATPQAALATIILPPASRELAARSLREIMQTAHQMMEQAGARIVGGHTTLGAELTIGFTVTGLCESAPISLSGARPGDALILTRPIGTGVIMAAHMAGQSRGSWVATALDQMSQPQGDAAHLLRNAHAMSDVTGFGLWGHLHNICRASGLGAVLCMNDVPLLPGALDLAVQGLRSSLFDENRAMAGPIQDRAHTGLSTAYTGTNACTDAKLLPAIAQNALYDLLFDPQTAGGLLAAVARDEAEQILRDLNKLGHRSAIIGEMKDHAGPIELR